MARSRGQRGKPRRAWRSLLQVAIGLAALAYVLSRVDRGEVVQGLAQADPRLLGAALLLTALAMVGMTSWRWQRLIAAQGHHVSLAHLAGDYLGGYFFNMVLPGSIGGDLFRIARLGGRIAMGDGSPGVEVAMASVVAERLLGLVALLPMGVVGFALSGSAWVCQREFVIVLSALCLALLSMPLWLRPPVIRLFRPLYERLFAIPLVQRLALRERAARLYAALSIYLRQPASLLVAFAISLGSRLVWAAAALLIGRAIGVRQPLAVYMAALAITELVRMVPISLGGIGVREGTFVILLAPLGVAGGRAFTLSFLFYLMLMLLGVVGGALYVVQGLRSGRARTPEPPG
jgi:uncharacterized protein (TIRG00374 family)